MSAQAEVWIRNEAARQGFDACGIGMIPEEWEADQRLRAFVAEGLHGQMDWMETTLERRSHPRRMWENARSAIVLAQNYAPDFDPREGLEATAQAQISVYARGDDYHDVIKKKLKAFGSAIVRHFGCELKVFVDTAPLMEKPLAQIAGLGWQGKHTNLVSRDLGSWFFLGVILTDMELKGDEPVSDHCGSCRACLESCPTGAFIGPYRLDARACLSYLTIEHKGPWAEAYRIGMGNRIYGCDDCLAACPWNKFAVTGHEAKLQAREALMSPDLTELAGLDDQAFRALFSKSPIKRIGVARFLRNVHYALGNHLRAQRQKFADCGNRDEETAVSVLISNLSHPDATARGSAVWALRQGLSPEAFGALKAKHLGDETEAEVLEEWGATS